MDIQLIKEIVKSAIHRYHGILKNSLSDPKNVTNTNGMVSVKIPQKKVSSKSHTLQKTYNA